MAEKTKDEVMPDGKWKFDSEVTDSFEDMLSRSIPQYEVMRDAVKEVVLRWLPLHGTVLDLGSSRGDAIDKLLKARGAAAKYHAVEISRPMVEVMMDRFVGAWEKVVTIHEMDLRHQFPEVNPDVVQSVLSLMFVPIEYRQGIVKRCYNRLPRGGAMVVVEKVLGNTSRIDKMMVRSYLDMKKSQGYTEEQIVRKKLSLEGVLVPLTAGWNEEMLRVSGFQEVDCFWRWMNFAAWVAIK